MQAIIKSAACRWCPVLLPSHKKSEKRHGTLKPLAHKGDLLFIHWFLPKVVPLVLTLLYLEEHMLKYSMVPAHVPHVNIVEMASTEGKTTGHQL